MWECPSCNIAYVKAKKTNFTNPKQIKKSTLTINSNEKTKLLIVGFICIVIGYFLGREHLKYEVRSSMEGTFTSIKESFSPNTETTSNIRPTQKLSQPKQVQFSGNRRIELLKASAIIDNIRIIGRDCEWALKVNDKKISSCTKFINKLAPGGENEHVSSKIQELISDEKFVADNSHELRTIVRHMEDIVRYKEFMASNLGVR